MVSSSSLAKMKVSAYSTLRETTQALADKFNVEPPDLDIHKRHPLKFRQVKELERIAEFLQSLNESLDEKPNTNDDKWQVVVDLVSKANWTKQELLDLVLGGE